MKPEDPTTPKTQPPAPETPADPKPTLTREAVLAQRARFASRLVMAEHELGDLRSHVAAKESEAEQLRGALQACDLLARQAPPAPPPAPAKPAA